MTGMKLITIISEPVLRESILTELKALGAKGFTTTACEGEGTRQLRAGELPGQHIKIESLVPNEIADRVLSQLDRLFFRDYEIIAFVSDVQVMRANKFSKPA